MVVDGVTYPLDPETLEIIERAITDWGNLPAKIWMVIYRKRGASQKVAKEMTDLRKYGFQPLVSPEGEIGIGRAGSGTASDAQRALDENPDWDFHTRDCLKSLVAYEASQLEGASALGRRPFFQRTQQS